MCAWRPPTRPGIISSQSHTRGRATRRRRRRRWRFRSRQLHRLGDLRAERARGVADECRPRGPSETADQEHLGMPAQFKRVADPFSRRGFLRLLPGSALSSALVASASGRAYAAAAADAAPFFEEIPPAASGISWKHVAGLSSEMYLPETIGPGCAFLDYDNDGWMDIYLVNSGPCDFYTPSAPLRNALYHNNRNGTFRDVTRKAGVGGGAYGMGVAVGDYDGDGLPDLYVTQYPRSILYHNNGDGTFTDVTDKADRK